MKKSRKPAFFESAWDKIVFIGSIVGLLFLIFISIYRNYQLEKTIKEYKTTVDQGK